MQKGFPDKDYCVHGVGTAMVKNTAGGVVSFCQTVLPGYEDMLIPTSISPGSTTTLAVPDTSYYAKSAAQYVSPSTFELDVHTDVKIVTTLVLPVLIQIPCVFGVLTVNLMVIGLLMLLEQTWTIVATLFRNWASILLLLRRSIHGEVWYHLGV